jgi:Zn-dependent protease with chaperone function
MSLIAQPAINAYSRRVEHEADVFAMEMTRDGDAGARAFLKLASQNRSNPEPPPIVMFWEYTHPPLMDRIRFAQSYRPWAEGRPNQFFHGPPAGG